MQLIGLIGGMSWESTASYYRLLNQGAQRRLGGAHSARILLYSVDFDPIVKAQHAGDWDQAAELLTRAAQALQRGGADFALLAVNTMHKVLPQIEQAVELPFLHIAEPTAVAIRATGHTCVALLGTRSTMEQEFYHERLAGHGIETLIPEEAERDLVHRVIFDELCQGIISEQSRRAYVQIIERLAAEGAESVVLGCTEIPLLIQQEHSPLPIYDTALLHAEAALDRALAVAAA